MILVEDKGNKEGMHAVKNKYWQQHDVEVLRYPLPVGDYVCMNEKIADVIARKDKRGIDIKKMDFLGTYNLCVDTKKDIQELVGNICGKEHARFRDECLLAQNNNIKLIILVENEGGLIPRTKDIYNPTIHDLKDLHKWKNPRLFIMENDMNEIIGYYRNSRPKYRRVQKYPNATKGITLQKACETMEEKYGCKFLFTTPGESGRKIIELLTTE